MAKLTKKERWLLVLLAAAVFFWVVDSVKKGRKIAFLEQYAAVNFEHAHNALQRVADLQAALLACQGEKADASVPPTENELPKNRND